MLPDYIVEESHECGISSECLGLNIFRVRDISKYLANDLTCGKASFERQSWRDKGDIGLAPFGRFDLNNAEPQR
jgi:hypothetical protein